MYSYLLAVFIVFISSFQPVGTSDVNRQTTVGQISLRPGEMTLEKIEEARDREDIEALYQRMQLQDLVNYQAFEQAILGYKTFDQSGKGIITLIDFSLPSTKKRMYVLDVKHEKLLYHSLVAHGRNSGETYARSFSNSSNSHKSSLGFYRTENTYMGSNGYSLVLQGLERGINDKAKERAVVIHGAAYCNPDVIAETGRLGRSYGCPALPTALAKPIINTIKDGTLLYIYADNPQYAQQSKVLKKQQAVLLAQQNIKKHGDFMVAEDTTVL